MSEVDIDDDLDDFPEDFEADTVSEDKIDSDIVLGKFSAPELENPGTDKSNLTTRRRLDALFEERALRKSICDDLYDPGGREY